MRGALPLLAILLAGPLSLAEPLLAQDQAPSGHRKWIFAALGGAAVGIPAMLSEDVPIELGGCNRSSCFGPVATVMGATVGFLIGLELDQRAARRFVAGPPGTLRATSVDVPLLPERLIAFRHGVLLLGEGGMAVAVEDDVPLRVPGIRGLAAAAALPDHEAAVASSGAALFAFPLDDPRAGGRSVFDRGGSLLAADGRSRLALGGGGELRVLEVRGRGSQIDISEVGRAPMTGAVRDAAWSADGAALWEVSGPLLTARDPVSLEALGVLELPAAARSLDLLGSVAGVAAGRGGVLLLDVADPNAPRLAGRYEGVREALDVALAGGLAYVAAGDQGVVVLDVTEPATPRVRRVVRNLGAVHAVERGERGVYFLDRRARRLHFAPDEEAAPPDARR